MFTVFINVVAALCFVYTVADLGTTAYLVRKNGVQEMRRRTQILFFG